MLVSISAALALAALAFAVLPNDAQARTPRAFFGVVPQTHLTGADIERMGEARVGTLRLSFSWGAIDPTPAPGDYQWGSLDALIGELARQRIRVLPYLDSTPEWAAKLDGRNCTGGECYPFAPKGRPALEAWRTFVGDVVERYGPEGEFWAQNPTVPQRPIRAYQIWNEQNSDTFYKPKPNVKAYAKLLAASHDAIRSRDRGAEVILGGMFGTPRRAEPPAIAAWDFLARLYRRDGVKRDFDGVAAHPYAGNMAKVRLQLDLFREAIRDARDLKASLWITEIGWASDGVPNPLNRGPQGQATRLRQAFDFFLRKRRKWKIENVDWYSWQDSPQGSLCEWCPYSGLVDEHMNPKPSLAAFTSFTNGR